MIKSASTEALSTTSARFARPEEESVDSELAKYLSQKLHLKEPRLKSIDRKDMNLTEEAERYSPPVTELGTEDVYSRIPPSAPRPNRETFYHQKKNKLKLEIPKYDINDPERSMNLYDQITTAMGFNEQEKLDGLIQAFIGTKLEGWFLKMKSSGQFTSYKKAVEILIFGKSDTLSLLELNKAFKRRQRKGESAAEFIFEKLTYYEDIPHNLDEAFIANHIALDLSQDIFEELMRDTRYNPLKSVTDLLNRATSIEKLLQACENRYENPGKKINKSVEFELDKKILKNKPNLTTEDKEYRDRINQNLSQMKKTVDELTRQMRATQYRNRQFRNPPAYDNYRQRPQQYFRENMDNRREMSSQNRDEPSLSNTAPKQQQTEANNNLSTNVPRNTMGEVKCFNCNKFGHYRRDCPRPQRNNGGYQSQPNPRPFPNNYSEN